MTNLVKENPKILSSPDLLKMNRCVSYMTFMLKEIHDYESAKTNNDIPLFTIRNFIKMKNQIKEKLENLKKFI